MVRVLVAMACVVVIAGGAYWGWTEWQRYEATEAAAIAKAEQEKADEAELYRLAEAEQSDTDKVKRFCAALATDSNIVIDPVQSKRVSATCTRLGF